MRLALPLLALLPVLALTALAQPPALMVGELGAGVIRQADYHDSRDGPLQPGACLQVITPVRLVLRAEAWSAGDVLTLHGFTLRGQVVSAPTLGTPPTATLEYLSPSSCVQFAVEGTQVAVAAVYTVSAS